MGKESKGRGKYLKETPKKRREGKPATIVLVSIIAILFAVLAVILWSIQDRSIYQTIVHDGYTGTQEQWLASLVGEETDAEAESAYELAVKNGYRRSEADWIETLIGVSTQTANASPYSLACENGFEGSLTEWLTQIADKPENLGVSGGDGQKTEYEFACEYGYSGTFIEWLVSVTHDHVVE